ncbi:hypothetical protein GCM10009587_20680 [Microbacterium maritypicum]
MLGPEACGDRVAEYEQFEGLSVETSTPQAIRVERFLAQRLPDPPSCERRLLPEHETEADQERDECHPDQDRRHDDRYPNATHAPIPPRHRERGVNGSKDAPSFRVHLSGLRADVGQNHGDSPDIRASTRQVSRRGGPDRTGPDQTGQDSGLSSSSPVPAETVAKAV